MKKLNLFLLAVLGVTTLHAAKIDQVIVRQQWPWSTDIKVEYRLLEVDAAHPVDLALKAYNGDVELPLPEAAITGDRYGITDAVGTFVIDPVVAFGTEKVALANFKVKLTVSDSPENIGEVLYRIYNMTSGACTDITRAEILNGKYGAYETDYAKIGDGFSTPLEDVLIWTGVTNYPGIYTTNLVMRKIAAKDKVWLMGDEPDAIHNKSMLTSQQGYTKLTEDFFIGVFELTQYQYHKMDQYGTAGYLHTDDPESRYPADGIYRYRLHSHPTGGTGTGMVTGEVVAWPTNSYLHDVGSNTALAWLRNKTGVEFDLPTAAQWEFACRAGTTNSLYSSKLHKLTNAGETNAKELGWMEGSSGGTTHLGGLKPANAFGLYDMQGNVSEYVQNASNAYANPTSGDGLSATTPLVDPKGNSDVSKNRVLKGVSYNDKPGTWHDARSGMCAAFYDWTAGGSPYSCLGARLVCPVNAQWAPHN